MRIRGIGYDTGFSTDGVNRFAVSGHACADTAGTNDITRAAFILALG